MSASIFTEMRWSLNVYPVFRRPSTPNSLANTTSPIGHTILCHGLAKLLSRYINLFQFFSYYEKARPHPEERHSLLLTESQLQSVRAVQTSFVLKPLTAAESQRGLNKLYQLQFNNSLVPNAGQTDMANKLSTNTKPQVTAWTVQHKSWDQGIPTFNTSLAFSQEWHNNPQGGQKSCLFSWAKAQQ